jgi:uncharacterized protein (DUF488 family)
VTTPGGTVFTVGHSTHPVSRLLELLQASQIDAVADVRTSPYSRRLPQFNRESLEGDLSRAGIAYVFLGRELGGRGSGNCVLGPDGRVSYAKLGATVEFSAGIERILHGMTQYRMALLCAERDPMECHRGLLISRALAGRGVAMQHIGTDGRIESQVRAEDRLLSIFGLSVPDLLRTDEEVYNEAYLRQESRVAYVDKGPHQPAGNSP